MSDKETSLAFVERMEKRDLWPFPITREDRAELVRLAKTAALIEEHRLRLEPSVYGPDYRVISIAINYAHHADLHTAVRGLGEKIKERT